MSRMRDFVVQEILDIIAQKQFDNESIPDMSGDRIEAIDHAKYIHQLPIQLLIQKFVLLIFLFYQP